MSIMENSRVIPQPITVDVEAELAKLDPAGWRPLRPAAPDLSLLL